MRWGSGAGGGDKASKQRPEKDRDHKVHNVEGMVPSHSSPYEAVPPNLGPGKFP